MISNEKLQVIDVGEPKLDRSRFPLLYRQDGLLAWQSFALFGSNPPSTKMLPLSEPIELPEIQCLQRESPPSMLAIHLGKEPAMVAGQHKLLKYTEAFLDSQTRNNLMRAIAVINSVALLAFDYQFRLKMKKELSILNIISMNVQLLCNSIFTADVAMGIIARGFFLPPKAYLRDWWNSLSFICVIATQLATYFRWLQVIFNPILYDNSGWYKLACVLSALRILKLVETSEKFRRPFQAFLRTIPALGQTLFPLGMFMLLYALTGLHFLRGSEEYRCKTTPEPYHGKWIQSSLTSNLCGSWQCPAGTYCGSNFQAGLPFNRTQGETLNSGYGLVSFNNFLVACETVAHYIFMQDWSHIMFDYSHHISKYAAAAYFITLAVLLFYMVSNLLLVSLNKSFAEEEKIKDHHQKLQVRSLTNKKKLFASKITMNKKLTKKLPYQNEFVNNSTQQYPKIEVLSAMCILTSCIVIAYDYPDITDREKEVLGSIDLALTCVLFVEIAFRLAVYRKEFIKSGANIMDAVIALLNIIELVLCASTNTSITNNPNPVYQLLRGSKFARVLRLYFQTSFFKYQRQIIRIFLRTLRRMFWFLMMWIFIVLVEAVIATVLFGYKARVGRKPHVTNFQGVYESIISVLLAFLNESWNEMMRIFYAEVGVSSAIFYFAVATIGHMMLLRLFLAQFLEYFMQAIREEDGVDSMSQFTQSNPRLELLGNFNENSIVQLQQESPTQIKAFKMYGSPVDDDLPPAERSGTEDQNTSKVSEIDKPKSECFEYSRPYRYLCRRYCQSRYARWIVFLTLAMLFARFAWYPVEQEVTPLLVKVLDITLAVVFFLEMLIQIVGYGLLGSKGYFERAWINPINMLVAAFTVLSFVVPYPYSVLFQKLKVLRFWYIIYDSYQRNSEMNIMLKSLSALSGKILKMVVLYMIFLMVVALIPTKLISSMVQCVNYPSSGTAVPLSQPTNKSDCMDWGGDWVNATQSFDSYINSWLLLYQIATSEGWAAFLQLTQAEGEGWKAFFVAFVFFGNFCILGVFVGLIVEPFLELKQKACKFDVLSPYQKSWFITKNSINELHPEPVLEEPQQSMLKVIFRIVDHKSYQKVLDYLACVNAVFLGMQVHRAPPAYLLAIGWLNRILILLFSVDTLVKLCLAGRNYFKLKYSVLELCGLLTYLLHFSGADRYFLDVQDIRVLSAVAVVFQLSRCFRFLFRFMWSRSLLNAVLQIIPKCKCVLQILLVTLLVYAVIGTYLLPYLRWSSELDGYNTGFSSLYTSMITLIKIASGEKWFQQMAAAIRGLGPNFACNYISTEKDFLKYGQTGCGTLWAYPYLFSFHLIFSVVVLNLLVATVLSAYNENYEKEYSSVNVFQLTDTLLYWQKYDPKGLGVISYKKFWRLSSEIAIIFGIKKEYLIVQENKEKFLKELKLQVYTRSEVGNVEQCCFRFHDVITAFSRFSMTIKSPDICEEELEPADEEVREQLAAVLSPVPDKLYEQYEAVPRLTSANLLVMFKTLKKLRRWRSQAVRDESAEVQEIFDILKLKQKKEQNDRERVIGSNIGFLMHIDDEASQLSPTKQ